MRCAVIGSGSWGTALAMQLARAGNDVRMWSRNPASATEIQRERENIRYLPGIRLPENISVSANMAEVVDAAVLVVVVVPSQFMRTVIGEAASLIPSEAVICCASKGVENGSLMTMHDVLLDVLPKSLHAKVCALAGPSFAREVAARPATRPRRPSTRTSARGTPQA